MRSRPATADDAPVIAHLYNQGIEERIATFEARLRTSEDIRGWMPASPSFRSTLTVPRVDTESVVWQC